ncbi:MAG: serine--tRNA ligase [Gemmatimonadota bacterium]
MLDLKALRESSEAMAGALVRRGVEDGPARVQAILQLDEGRRDAITRADALKAIRNQVSREIGHRKGKGEDASEAIARMREIGDEIQALDATVSDRDDSIRTLLMELPNVPLARVPEGGVEANQEIRRWGEAPTFPFQPRPHWELGEALDILDLPRGARVSGSGFPVLKGAGARYQRRLIDWMLDLHVDEHGYEELRVPYLVTRDTLTGTGQLPKFAEESYLTERDDLWLIPTAEVPVTNLHGDELFQASGLPVKYVAYSPCFRREAGAAGADTRGLLRVHQFDKVELVRLERPDDSAAALEELTGHAERILQLLGLHYRVVLLAAGDLGFSSAMTYDVEVWAPGVERWLEVSSCSVFNDFQSRRINLRYRPAPGEKPEFLHTLNGSALALPRLMVALWETYQDAEGGLEIPPALQEVMGTRRIPPIPVKG